jgi:hypothetical protein
VPIDGNRAAFKPGDGSEFVTIVDDNAKGPKATSAEKPGPGHTVEVFRAVEVPELVCTALGVAIAGLAEEELEGEEYVKTRKRKTRKYVDLPAPTFRNLGRMKRHRVVSFTEEYFVQARLDGTPEVRITRMTFLGGHFEPESGLLLFGAEARLPVAGRVRYKIPDAVSASTGYAMRVDLDMQGEVRVQKSDDGPSLNPPELRQLRVEMRQLELSNEVLHTVRHAIEDLANHELRRKRDEIRRKANRAIAKAVEKTEFRLPLLEHIALP